METPKTLTLEQVKYVINFLKEKLQIPLATAEIPGIVKVGEGIAIDSAGTLSVDKEFVLTTEDYIDEYTAFQQINTNFDNDTQSPTIFYLNNLGIGYDKNGYYYKKQIEEEN